ncbi:ISAs1 family transposase [Streptomyces sp. NPDC054794]
MPARSSSLIPRPLGQLADTAPTVPDDLPGLLTCLAQVPDPRRDQGRRHPLAFVLSLAACAVLAGAKSLAAIAEWAADAPPNVLARLGGPCREPGRGPVAPAEATVRRVLQRIDGDALDTAVGSWLAGRERASGQEENDSDRRPLPSLAVDGKTVRGARRTDGTQVHLLAAMTGTGLVTAQREVDATTNEITVFQPLLAPLNLHGTVVTFDALHSQTAHARFLVEDKHAHYIALIKGNQPTLHQWLKALPWREVPLLDKTRATAHGRDEIRRIKAAAVAGIAFPHAVQAVQIDRRSAIRQPDEHRRWTPPPHPRRQPSTDHPRHHVINQDTSPERRGPAPGGLPRLSPHQGGWCCSRSTPGGTSRPAAVDHAPFLSVPPAAAARPRRSWPRRR